MKLCGCYHESVHGTVKILEPLPRVDVKAHTTIFSTASQTELTQTFINSFKTQSISECQYVFPLYDGVSIVHFSCQVGSRVINGVVKEKADAKETFDKAVSQGQVAGLLDQGPSSDVFVTSLGNIPAGEKLLVKIKFIGELKHDLALQGVRFTLPTFISPRYGSGAPQGNVDSSSAEGISIIVDINMSAECPIEKVRSPSHPISLSLGRTSIQSNAPSSLSRASATLSLGEVALDKDFVLEICHKDNGKPMAFLETHPTIVGQRALMTTLVPSMGPLRGENPEIVIVADQSGSMQGGRTATLVSALKVLLKSLPVNIKFNICAFGSHHCFLWEESHKYNEKSLTQALKFLQSFHGSMGGTETLSAVQAAIESRDPTKNLSLILATDGDIWQQDCLFSYIDTQLADSFKNIRVFPLGIGNSVSSSLIEGVARAGNGFASSVGEGEKLDSKVIRMLKGAMTPDSGNYTLEIRYHQDEDEDEDEYELVERVTDSLRILMVDEGPLGASAMVIDKGNAPSDTSKIAGVVEPKLLQAPQRLPPLYPMSKSVVYILLSPKAARTTPKSVILRNDAVENPFEISIPVEILSEPATTIHSLAAKGAIVELEEGRGWLKYAEDAQNQLIRDVYPVEKYQDTVKAEAVRLGVQYQITSKYTSSVAVESDSALEHTHGIGNDIIIAPSSASATIWASESRRRAYGDNAYGARAPSATLPPPPSAAPLIRAPPNVPKMMEAPVSRTGSLSSSSIFRFSNAPEVALRGVASMCSSRGSESSYGSRGATFASGSRGGAALFGSSVLNASYRTGEHRITPMFGQRQRPGEESATKSYVSDAETMGFSENNDESIAEVAERRTRNRTDSELLRKLIALQSFAGFWNYEKKLLVVCSVSGFPAQPKGTDSSVWGTMIALEFLNLKLKEEEETWEMVADKAWAWLETQGFDKNGKEIQMLLQEARKLVQGA